MRSRSYLGLMMTDAASTDGKVGTVLVYLVVENVHMRKPGISDLTRSNGVRRRASWIARGTGTVMYRGTARHDEAEAVRLAHAWLARNPACVDTTNR